jgi:hypothetical protein
VLGAVSLRVDRSVDTSLCQHHPDPALHLPAEPG